MKSPVIHADETPVMVTEGMHKNYMWVYRSGNMCKAKQIVSYDYQKRRKVDAAYEFLNGFKGKLVCDGYQVYHIDNQLLKLPPSKRKKRIKKPVKPLVDAFFNWCRDSLGRVVPSSETAKANELNIYQYFKHLLTEIPKHMDNTDLDFLENLLPWSKQLSDICRKKKKQSK